MSADGQGTKCRRNIAENFNRLSMGRAIAYSERELTFTFAKNLMHAGLDNKPQVRQISVSQRVSPGI